MATYAPSIGRTISADWRKLAVSPWIWCLVAVALLAAQELGQGYGELLTALGDTDDALRLHEVRELLAGKAWTDMSLPRLGGATPLVSHWSRLIDLPLAILISLFGLVMSPANAELATRIAWPMIVLALFLRIAVYSVMKQGSETAPVVFLAIAVTCLSGLFQFNVGRIDHHNMMILGAAGGLLVMVGARQSPRDGAYAGALVGLALSVGYEPLALLVPAIAGAALLAIYDLRWHEGIRNLLVAMAGVMATVLIVTVSPSGWFVARCDALSLNMVILVACGAAGLVCAERFARTGSFAMRLAILAAGGAVGAVLYAMPDTRCLGGPFGQVDPKVGPIWLDKVVESYNAWRMLQLNPMTVVLYAVTTALSLGAAIERWRRLRTPETAMLLALMLLAAPFGFWIIKLVPYASWIAIACIALSLADIRGNATISAPTLQAAGALAASQWITLLVASQIAQAAGMSQDRIAGKQELDASACMKTGAISSLNALPKGFVVGNIDLGSYIVALTPHSVLAAPYHRIDKAILANQSILNAPPGEAPARLRQVGADYLVLCLPKPGVMPPGVAPESLFGTLARKQAVEGLEPVTLDSPVAQLQAWRVHR